MRNKVFIFILFSLLIQACSKTKTDAYLLEQDKKKLKENLDYDKITFYKFVKIGVRSNAVQDTTKPEYQKFSRHFQTVSKASSKIDTNETKISIADALLMYRDYRAVQSFVKTTDEDIFPSLLEGIYAMNSDRSRPLALMSEKDKIKSQNLEHAILSMIVLATRDFGQPFALYECSMTHPEYLPDGELKTLLEFVRGFLFFGNSLYYLSEDGISRNIVWLDKNPNISMPYTKAFFGWRNLSDEQTHTAFHSMNYLFRGFDRLMMEREIDEERALEDFEKFVADTKKLGLENELTLSVESYLYLKKQKPEKAIAALTKLNQSPLLSSSEHEALTKTIAYVQKREPDAALNGVYDKVFLSKVATKYMIAVSAKINWEKVLKDNNVPHTQEIFGTLRKVQQISNSVSTYTSNETLDKKKTAIKQKSKALVESAKDLFK